MRAKLGPQGLILLRHMAESGPITPRVGGGLLHPDAKGQGSVRGTGRGNTDARGTANRAAGTLLGHMERAGWVVAGKGERYHVPYSITDSGREALLNATEELEADPVVGIHDRIPEDRKRCNRCGRARKRTAFYRDSQNPDALGKRCRFCGLEEQAERRGALIVARDADAEWMRASKEVVVLRCLALIRAARNARRVGAWRGQEGLRAYASLGDALDLFTGNGSNDPSAIASEACEPRDTSRPDHCDPHDADWTPERHGTQPWLTDIRARGLEVT